MRDTVGPTSSRDKDICRFSGARLAQIVPFSPLFESRRAGGPRGGQFSGRKRHFMRVFATSLHLFTPLTFIFNRLNQITPPSCAAAHATLDHPRRFRRLSHGPTPKSAVYVTVLQVTQTIRAARLTPSIAASRGDVDEGGGASGGGRGKDGGHLGGGANGGEVNSCGREGSV